jgi:dUTP pyrophosphatase
MDVKVKYTHEDSYRLQTIKKGDWIDLVIDDDISVEAGDVVKVPLGLAIKLPDGVEAHILPRSSTFIKTGLLLANSVGVIDNSYSGDDDEWCAVFYATCASVVGRGTRLLQFRLVDTQATMFGDINFEEVTKLDDVNRGGFGSTGSKGFN